MPSRGFPALVAEVLDPCQVIINRGSDDQVKIKQRFLIYELTKEIIRFQKHTKVSDGYRYRRARVSLFRFKKKWL